MADTVSAFAAYQANVQKRKASKSTIIDSNPKKLFKKEAGKKKLSNLLTRRKLNSSSKFHIHNQHVSIQLKEKNDRLISKEDTLKGKKGKKHGKKKKANAAKTDPGQNSEEEPPVLVPIQNIANFKKTDLKNKVVNSLPFNNVNPVLECLTVFKMLISPHTQEHFLKHYWEKEVLHIQHDDAEYFKHILTTHELDEIIRSYPLHFTRNVDVVSYENGVKEMHNPEGRALPSVLWDFYSNGCSIRVLNPQTYSPKIHLIISNLQEYFGTMVGANLYLTPPNSQGFAPHFDDIEAFILQLEGRKHWKLYIPQDHDLLARDSSKNFKHEELGDPFKEVTLEAGDLLYFPRGTIHEGRTDSDNHSLHITISVYQHTAYIDLLEHVLPKALKVAGENDVNFRKGLPINYLKHLGHVNRNKQTNIRLDIKKKVEDLLEELTNYIDLDVAADKLGRKFMYDCMPPVLTSEEANCSSRYDGDYMKKGKVYNRVEISLDTNVRLLRYHCLRLLIEDTPKIYFCTDNAKFYHGEEEQWLELERSHIPIIEKLQEFYPRFLSVEELPGDDDSSKMSLIADLWERGLLVTDNPLVAVDGESDDSSNL